MLLLQGVLGATGYRDLQFYVARIDCTYLFRERLWQSTRHAQPFAHQDWFPGRGGEVGYYIWVDILSVEVVRGNSVERFRSQAFRQ